MKRVFDYLGLGPETVVPVARGEDAPSEADLRYVDRNQEIQDIYDTRILARIRKTFHRKTDALFTRRFMVLELAPVDQGGFQAVVIFEGVSHPFWARFVTIKNECVLRKIEAVSEPLDEMLLDEVHTLAYERFWT